MIHESSKSTPYQTNNRDASIESSNRHKTENAREPCKYKDCVNGLNLYPITCHNQTVYLEIKEHTKTLYDEAFLSKYKLMLKGNNSGMKSHKCRKSGKFFTMTFMSLHQLFTIILSLVLTALVGPGCSRIWTADRTLRPRWQHTFGDEDRDGSLR